MSVGKDITEPVGCCSDVECLNTDNEIYKWSPEPTLINGAKFRKAI